MEYLFPLIYALSFLPIWSAVSIGITFVHTAEEVEGDIWTKLGVPAFLYFAFQFCVVLLGCLIILQTAAYILIGIRLIDVLVTHVLLKMPGRCTAPLLLIDAAVVYSCFG